MQAFEVLNVLEKNIDMFLFSIIFLHWEAAGKLNLFSRNTMIYPSYAFNTSTAGSPCTDIVYL